ncbi:syntaxin-7 [Sabethes cyaneus]|uniref:syntaxin-7 n=1 Tax=Sabethes cyaneus TaxID=53552 RepID=UPI00237EC707|nr:syntaxin-7 [Sabethes cyaneus]XP_053686753.1 syntaxin-7 [Sabethes cyaneus]
MARQEGAGSSRTGSGSWPRDYGAISTTGIASMPPDDNNSGGFSPTEFISLSESIASNSKTVKQSWLSLDKLAKCIGTTKDNAALRENVHSVQTTTNKMIATTSKDLKRLKVVVQRGDKAQKLMVQRLTTEFSQIVRMYSQSQQIVASKLKQILIVNPSQPDEFNSSGSGDGSNVTEEQLLLKQQQQLHQDLQFENDLWLERDAKIRAIEADVLDVQRIMTELAGIANQQGDVLDTIENTIENTVGNVESGTSELVKAAQYQNRYRRKVIILLIIAVILGVIVTGIIVSRLKN